MRGSSSGILADSMRSSGICITLFKTKLARLVFETLNKYVGRPWRQLLNLHFGRHGLQYGDNRSLEELMSIKRKDRGLDSRRLSGVRL